MVCVLAGALTLAIALVAAKDVSAAPSPALAGGATQISGVGFFADKDVCGDSEGEGANYALILNGDLKGCLYTFIETTKSSPSGTYRETGTEVFVSNVPVSSRNEPTKSSVPVSR